MKPHWRKLCLPLLLVCGFAVVAQSQTPVANNKKVIEDARHAYYGLRTAGLDEFRATVKPNWELVLKDQMKADPAAAQAAVKLLNALFHAAGPERQSHGDAPHRHRAIK
jgi:hypothetical protein